MFPVYFVCHGMAVFPSRGDNISLNTNQKENIFTPHSAVFWEDQMIAILN